MTHRFEIIPAIDILDGKVVRLTKGDYGQVEHYDKPPQEFAIEFYKAGARRIHLVDLNGAKDGKLTNLEVFKKIRQSVPCQLELGGGIRTHESLTQLLDIGINTIILGSLLTKNLPLAKQWMTAHPQKIIAGIDAKNNTVAVEGWIEASTYTVQDLITALTPAPLESIIYTDIAKDGTLEGPNIPGLLAVANHSPYPVIASGGVGTLSDIKALKDLNHPRILGCIVGKAFLSGKISLIDALTL